MIKKRQQYDMSEQNESKGMELYEYIVDHVDELGSDPKEIVDQLRAADQTGQFLASTARYLAAIDRERFEGWLSPLVEGAIEKDRERGHTACPAHTPRGRCDVTYCWHCCWRQEL